MINSFAFYFISEPFESKFSNVNTTITPKVLYRNKRIFSLDHHMEFRFLRNPRV